MKLLTPRTSNVAPREAEMNLSMSKSVFHTAILLFVAALFAGCGSEPKLTPADPKQAAATLQSTLEKWKSGVPLDDLRQAKPVVHVVDEDWQGGLKLVNFVLRDVSEQGGVNARIPVGLNIQSSNGMLWKEVEYDVQTEPVISIVRRFE
jgi:hypothetical protein